MPTTAQLQTAATMRAQGDSYRVIGAAIGMDNSYLAKTLKKDELQQLIRQAQIDLIGGSLSAAVQNQRAKIDAGRKIADKIATGETPELPEGSTKLMELGHDAERRLLESVGIHPSHTQSIQINQILVDARTELSPTVEALLVRHLGGQSGGDGPVIEAEAVDNSEDRTV